MVDGEGCLAETLAGMLRDEDAARALGERGRAVFEAEAGATARTVRALMELMEERVVRGDEGEETIAVAAGSFVWSGAGVKDGCSSGDG